MKQLQELGIRAFWTFVKTFLGALGAAGLGIVDVDTLTMAAISGAGAVLTLVQIFAAQRLEASSHSTADTLRGTPS